jgi:hypothetical protein
MASTDLSARFGRSAAANKQALGSLLPSRPAPRLRSTPDPESAELSASTSETAETDGPSTAEAPVASTDTRPDAPATVRPARVRNAGRELRQAPAAQEQSQTHQTVVYVSAGAKAAAERRRKQHGLTNAEIALDALDQTHDELRELLDARYTPRSEDSLFPGRRVPRRASSPSTRKVTFTFQATAVELSIIQDMVRDFGATSQSELIAVAMESYLLQGRGRRKSSS